MRHAAVLAAALALSVPAAAQAETTTLYAISNKADGNTVMAFQKDATGAFAALGEYATGGLGTGDLEIPALEKDPDHPLANGDDPLISAYAIAATDDGGHVLAVNPGDATVALLRVEADKSLALVNTAAATDKFPVSIAAHGDMIVVASVGETNTSGSIGAYRITEGRLAAVDGSRRDLGARPSTIGFSSDGAHVIVNELVTGKIHAFAAADGSLSDAPVSTADSPRAEGRFQAIPVGFAVAPGAGGDVIMMSEARFLTPEFGLRAGDGSVTQSPLYSWQTSSLSTYRLGSDGALSLVTGDALTGPAVEGGEIANCWVALSPDGQTLWTANALSSSISAFAIGENGAATLVNHQAFKIEPATLFFGDITVSASGDELYQLIGNTGQILVLSVGPDGRLILRQILSGLPAIGAYGLLAL